MRLYGRRHLRNAAASDDLAQDVLLRTIERDGRWPTLLRVIISTDGSAARRAEADELHVRLYVEKPFRPEVMRDVLSELATHA